MYDCHLTQMLPYINAIVNFVVPFQERFKQRTQQRPQTTKLKKTVAQFARLQPMS